MRQESERIEAIEHLNSIIEGLYPEGTYADENKKDQDTKAVSVAIKIIQEDILTEEDITALDCSDYQKDIILKARQWMDGYVEEYDEIFEGY